MTPDENLDEIADALAPAGAEPAAMFGKRSLNVSGKAFACLKGDLLAFRLGAGSAHHASALAIANAELFDPAGKGHPFKDWVAVPHSSVDEWLPLAREALVHTAAVAAK